MMTTHSNVPMDPSTKTWLEWMDEHNFAAAEAVLFKDKAAWTPDLYEHYVLMFIQGIKNVEAWQAAIDYTYKYEPTLGNNERKALLYGWLAHMYETLGELERAVKTGHRAVELYDAAYCMQYQQQEKGVVSFSLFGDSPKYCETAIVNAELIPSVYPHYVMQVYHDDSVPQHVLDRLAAFAWVELVHVNSIHARDFPGTFWRFLAVEDLRFDIVLFRDIDSVISDREKVLVAEWLAQPAKPVHIMRDWYTQTDLMLAGLWGVRGKLLSGVRALMQHYIQNTPNLHKTHADQMFLAQYIWPRIRHCMVHHDSLFSSPNSSWPASLPKPVNSQDALGGIAMTHYALGNVPEGTNYQVTVFEGERVVCRYKFLHGSNEFYLPRLYGDRIRSEQYRLDIKSLYKVKIVDQQGRETEQEIAM